MSNRQRAFTFSPPDQSPVEFKINKTKIRGIPDIDGLTLLNYVAALNDSDRSSDGLIRFLKEAIVEEDYPLFEQAVKDAAMSIENITELAGWLLEVYTERPTISPSDSSPGQSETGSGSTAGSSSPGLTSISKAG